MTNNIKTYREKNEKCVSKVTQILTYMYLVYWLWFLVCWYGKVLLSNNNFINVFVVFPVGSTNSRPPSRSVQVTTRLPGDEKLGFEGAVAALGISDF